MLEVQKEPSSTKDFIFMGSFLVVMAAVGFYMYTYGSFRDFSDDASGAASVVAYGQVDSGASFSSYKSPFSTTDEVSLRKLWFLFNPNEAIPTNGPDRDISFLRLINNILQAGIEVLTNRLKGYLLWSAHMAFLY